jgi:CRISPR system Cascade subunit CasD
MNTLLIRLAAPLQAWGVQSNFGVRDSGREPSKSGVIGLICAALGRPRTAPLEDLSALRMGVRVDREGSLRRDFQIAQDVLASSGKGTKGSITSSRYYLSDAAFLVGLESDDLPLLESVQAALRAPVWTLFLGRKACPPAGPVWLADGLRTGLSLEKALQTYGWICSRRSGKTPEKLRVVIDDPAGEQLRPDVPVSFAERRFSSRRVHTYLIDAPSTVALEVF